MPFTLEIRWDNAAQSLLADAVATLFADYSPGTPPLAPPTKSKLTGGGFRFDVSGEPFELELMVGFNVNLPSATIKERRWVGLPPEVKLNDTIASAVSTTVLTAHQVYAVRDGNLVPIADASAFGSSPHPLLSAPKAAAGGVSITLQTGFVDVTKLWMNRAIDADRYMKLHQAKSRLVALAFTDPGGPLIWFAVIPNSCQRNSSVSCVVFFRPTGHYQYTSLDDRRLDAYPLNRYLISPREDLEIQQRDFWAFDRFFLYHPADRPPAAIEVYRDLCVGMEQALVASKKSAILLIPWPSGSDFGSAPSAKLQPLVSRVLHFLWSKGLVAKGASEVSLKELALAGFSSGGGQLFQSLSRNSEAVSEVYAFDCEKMDILAEQARKWAKQSGRRLRMTAGLDKTIKANQALRRRLVDEDKKDPDHVSADPKDETSAWDAGANPWWDYVTSLGKGNKKDIDAIRAARQVRHQFAMFGGRDPTRDMSYLAEFLERSTL